MQVAGARAGCTEDGICHEERGENSGGGEGVAAVGDAAGNITVSGDDKSNRQRDDRHDDHRVEEEDVADKKSPEELKELGNAAYSQRDMREAVDLWSKALRQHVARMEHGDVPGHSVFSEATRTFERSLYLNLAQGYLKLGEPDKTLRACQVVMAENRADVKACYRAAEACLALRRFDEAEKCLAPLLKSDSDHTEANRLLTKVKAERRALVKKEQKISQRMCAGMTGFSEDRKTRDNAVPATSKRDLGHLHNMDPTSMAMGLDIGEAAARAACLRQDRLASKAAADREGELPVPTVYDFDSFRSKCMARSKKYTTFAERSRRKQDESRRSAHLAWLRTGKESQGFDAFATPLHQELQKIEEADQLRDGINRSAISDDYRGVVDCDEVDGAVIDACGPSVIDLAVRSEGSVDAVVDGGGFSVMQMD
eukprot:TRINITY_DN68378_c0_g1_i1.p1 TRINITY_DN68378_c0_g1~~TRINITY_DN68378_c0_g1_i1.p1  ORF type:complete len:426 (+),score=80.47 TRINITY_DN68378_c0_g1_i1:98-1375(+)